MGPPLIDSFGRVASDLRLSLTDRCQLRCTYCMPAEGVPLQPRASLLTDDELVRLTAVFVGLGVTSIRLTGGEPTLHPRLAELIRRLAALEPRPELSLTTNAVTFAQHASAVAQAGLDRINISLDTLDRQRFHELTRRDRLDDVLTGIAAASSSGMDPIKINTVLVRNHNDAEASTMLDWALRAGYQLRFIEHMPLDGARSWDKNAMVSADETLARLRERYVLRPLGHQGPAPAEEFEVVDGPGASAWLTHRVGVIASVTRPFCRDCDRLRLTADGQLRTCLFATRETDLRGPMRAGAADDELGQLIVEAVGRKAAGHSIGSPDFVQPARPMSAIGG